LIGLDTGQITQVGNLLTQQRGRRQVVVSRPGWDIINSPIKSETNARSYDQLFKPIFPPLIDSFTDLVDDFVMRHNNEPPLWLEIMGTVRLLENLEVPGIAVGLDANKRTTNLIQLNTDLLNHEETFHQIDSGLHQLRPNRPFPNFITWKGEGGLMGIPQDPNCFAFFIYNLSILLDYNGSGYYQVPGRLMEQTQNLLKRFFGEGTGFSVFSARGQRNFTPYDGLIRIDRLINY
jgi:hypothetical protein